MKLVLKIAYDGSKFCGMQSQECGCSVEDKLKAALASLGIFSKLEYAGRTDRGVHALGQYVSFSAPEYWRDLTRFKFEMESKLFPAIQIRDCFFREDSFHARFSATKREYLYLISPKPLPPFCNDYALYSPHNIDLIADALPLFLGEHDFKNFMLQGSEIKGSTRIIHTAKMTRRKGLYLLHFAANGFLRSQIRLMVGFLLEIAKGRLSAHELALQLQGEQIFHNEPISPAGLYLKNVSYQ